MPDFTSLTELTDRQENDEIAVVRGSNTRRVRLSVAAPDKPTHLSTPELSDYEGHEDVTVEAIALRGGTVASAADYLAILQTMFALDEEPGSQEFTSDGKTTIHWLYAVSDPDDRALVALLESGDLITITHTNDNGDDLLKVVSVTDSSPGSGTGTITLRATVIRENDLGWGDTGISSVRVQFGTGATGILIRSQRGGRIVTTPVNAITALADDGTAEGLFRSLKGRQLIIRKNADGETEFFYDSETIVQIYHPESTPITVFIRETSRDGTSRDGALFNGQVKAIDRTHPNFTGIIYENELISAGPIISRNAHSGEARSFNAGIRNQYGLAHLFLDDNLDGLVSSSSGANPIWLTVTGEVGETFSYPAVIQDDIFRGIALTIEVTIVSPSTTLDPP